MGGREGRSGPRAHQGGYRLRSLVFRFEWREWCLNRWHSLPRPNSSLIPTSLCQKGGQVPPLHLSLPILATFSSRLEPRDSALPARPTRPQHPQRRIGITCVLYLTA